jgi:DNA-binding transcriptional MerR regulator
VAFAIARTVFQGGTDVPEFPSKEFYRLNEVCRYTDTQPYVLRFWESEFPQLKPRRSGSGQPVYRREDLELVRRIKQLLYDEECSLEAARKELEAESGASGKRRGKAEGRPPAKRPAGSSSAGERRRGAEDASTASRGAEPASPPESYAEQVSRQRYEDAVEEIHHLRMQLQEAEKARRKAESSLQQATEAGERFRRRNDRAGQRIEQLLERLS